MSIPSIKENTFLIDQIRYAYRFDKQNDDEQSELTYNLKSSKQNSLREQKSTVVSERINEQTNFFAYGYRLQNGVPVSKSEKPFRQFNDPRKKQTISVEDEETGEFLESEIINDENDYTNPLGKGFYVSGGNSYSNQSKTKSMSELFQEKIYHVYNIGYTREPGTLVNLVF